VTSIPPYFQYFSDTSMGAMDPIMDFCPVYEGQGVYDACIQTRPPTESDVALGDSYGPSSRCFNTGLQGTQMLVAQGYSVTANDDGIRCLQSRCTNGGASIEVMVGTTWIPCPTDGSMAIIDTAFLTRGAFSGSIECPSARKLCRVFLTLPGTTPALTPSPTAAPMSVVNRDATALDSDANFFSKWNVGMIGGIIGGVCVILSALLLLYRYKWSTPEQTSLALPISGSLELHTMQTLMEDISANPSTNKV